MKKPRKVALAVAGLAMLSAAVPASAGPANGANCVGQSISFFGPIGAGLFEILAFFGGAGVGEVARTHCDPNWD